MSKQIEKTLALELTESLSTFLAARSDEIDPVKVQIIKEALETKRYIIHDERIAHKLLAFSLVREEEIAL